MPSRESALKLRGETVHTTTINTADEGNHAPLSREDEDEADPAPSGDIEMRAIGPDRDRDQGPMQVCPTQPMHVVHAYIRRVTDYGLPRRQDACRSLP